MLCLIVKCVIQMCLKEVEVNLERNLNIGFSICILDCFDVNVLIYASEIVLLKVIFFSMFLKVKCVEFS